METQSGFPLHDGCDGHVEIIERFKKDTDKTIGRTLRSSRNL